MKRVAFGLLCITLLFTSCASLNFSNPGVGRVKRYTFRHKDVPEAFNGYRIAFISDLHYKSLFGSKRLKQLVKTINKQQPDLLLMGGDYHEGCQYIDELFAELSQIETTDGTVAIMGNHDYAACYDLLVQAMQQYDIRLLEHQTDTITRQGQRIFIAGVRNPFDLTANGVSPSLALSDNDFVILLVHTPEYTEQVSIARTDLALSGHTHGGQVTLFGYAPILHSPLERKLRTGLKHNSSGTPVIITNGLGTSRKNIRMFAPSEVIMITLAGE